MKSVRERESNPKKLQMTSFKNGPQVGIRGSSASLIPIPNTIPLLLCSWVHEYWPSARRNCHKMDLLTGISTQYDTTHQFPYPNHMRQFGIAQKEFHCTAPFIVPLCSPTFMVEAGKGREDSHIPLDFILLMHVLYNCTYEVQFGKGAQS